MSRLVFSAVKKPAGNRLQGINIEHGGKTLHFKPQSLSVGDVVAPDKFMSSVNKFFDNFSDEDHKAVFEVYEEVAIMRDAPKITHEAIFSLDEALEVLFEIVTLERIQAWGRDNDDYAKVPSLDNITPMRDGSESHSCNKTEYMDICILSTLFKILIPFQEISSHVAEYIPNVIVEHWTLFSVINRAALIEDYPAYAELIRKTMGKAESILGKGVPTGLTARGIGEEDFYKIILIPKLFRDVTRLETEVETFANGTNNNISYKINMAIANHIRHDIGSKYKFNTTQGQLLNDEDGGNTTRQEGKAGGERVSSIYGIYFTRDYENFIEIVHHSEEFPPDLKIPAEEVIALADKYPKRTIISPGQDMIAGAIFDEVLPMDSAQYRPPSTHRIMLAYTSLIADKLGLANISALMKCLVDEVGQLTESETRNSALTSPFVHPLLGKVLDLYPTEVNGHPFRDTVDLILKNIVRVNYTIAIPFKDHQLGSEWYPKIVNDMGIKDELVALVAHLNGVK